LVAAYPFLHHPRSQTQGGTEKQETNTNLINHIYKNNVYKIISESLNAAHLQIRDTNFSGNFENVFKSNISG
jgi:hypothetical protein